MPQGVLPTRGAQNKNITDFNPLHKRHFWAKFRKKEKNRFDKKVRLEETVDSGVPGGLTSPGLEDSAMP